MIETKSNIIDKPRQAGARDSLGTDKYMEALIRFIGTANMPTTIAIQGEWGSGKTSMMNQIRHHLCETTEDDSKEFYGIWLNTWQYSLMKSPEETLINIITGLTKKVLALVSSKHESKTAQLSKKVWGILSLVAKSTAKSAISTTGLDGDGIVDGVLDGGTNEANILELRDVLQEAINQCLAEDKKSEKPKKGFLFFVDDLDRIDPPVAVQILELVKNIFEVDNCLFVLAIDYDVVVKGLEPKFGQLTEKNEREFRSFFDKIIQLPFSMPINNYNIEQFLSESLQQVGYITPEFATDSSFQVSISNMAMESVGTNPRAIKRLTNTLSLIQIMNEIEDGEFGETKFEKLINFGLVCLQIAYPTIYDLVVKEPDFLKWNDKLASKLRLKPMTEEQIERLGATEQFDEEWEKVVFRACANDAFLSSKAFNVSNLLNVLRTIYQTEKKSLDGFGQDIETILTLSAVTSVSADKNDKPIKFSKVRVEGWDAYETLVRQRGATDNTLAIMKKIHDWCIDELGDRVKFQLGPNYMTIQSTKSKIRSKTVVWCWHLPKTNQAGFSGIQRFGSQTNELTFDKYEDFLDEHGNWIVKGVEAFENGNATLVE